MSLGSTIPGSLLGGPVLSCFKAALSNRGLAIYLLILGALGTAVIACQFLLGCPQLKFNHMLEKIR